MADYTAWGIGVSALLVLSTIIFLSKTPKKSNIKAEKPKKLSLVERFELTLKEVDGRVSKELAPGVQGYYDQFDALKTDDKTYKFNYFQEELLKELIKLDGIELSDMPDEDKKAEFKARRKEAIKATQSVIRGLDMFKKEHLGQFE